MYRSIDNSELDIRKLNFPLHVIPKCVFLAIINKSKFVK